MKRLFTLVVTMVVVFCLAVPVYAQKTTGEGAEHNTKAHRVHAKKGKGKSKGKKEGQEGANPGQKEGKEAPKN